MKNHSSCAMIRSLPVAVILLLALLVGSMPLQASRNLLPRLPQIIIEKGFSDAFQVTSCLVTAEVVNDAVSSKIDLQLKNTSATAINTSLKIRLLYLANDQAAKIQVNGKNVSFDRKQPRLPVTLEPGGTLSLVISSRQNILYNLDAMKTEAEKSRKEKKEARFAIDDLTKLFERESFGHRLMIGPFVSKWGLFPITFDKVSIELKIPREYAMIAPPGAPWQVKTTSRNQICTFEGTDEYTGTVFLPATDEAGFRKWQAADQAISKEPVQDSAPKAAPEN